MTDERGVSNTLGFIILFGVVFASIALVSTGGMGALAESRDRAIEQNAAASMQGLGDAIEDLREENTTSRLSVLRGAGGTLSSGEETTINVTVDGDGSYNYSFYPIVNDLGDESIIYEAGAIIRTQEGGGAVAIEDPSYEGSDEVVILPIIATDRASAGSVSGGTVTTYLERASATLDTRAAPSGNVTFNITTTEQRAPVWQDMLNEEFPSCGIESGDTVTCTGTSNNAIVREIRVTYEFVT